MKLNEEKLVKIRSIALNSSWSLTRNPQKLMEEEDRASEEMDTEKVNNNGNKYRDRVLLSTECIGNLEQ